MTGQTRDRGFWRWLVIALCLWATAWSGDRFDGRGSIVASLDGTLEPAEEISDDGDFVQPVSALVRDGAQAGAAPLVELRAPQTRDRGEARLHNRGPPRA
jgi:hypothetical protein